MRVLRSRVLLPCLTTGVLLASGCAVPVSVDAPESAAAAACSPVMLGLPQEIDSLAKRVTTSQSTAAWGDPASIILSCGTPDRGPTSDPCTTVDGVDWVAHENDSKTSWTLTAYGRVPGLEVVIDTSKVSSATVAAALTESARLLPATKKCLASPQG